MQDSMNIDLVEFDSTEFFKAVDEIGGMSPTGDPLFAALPSEPPPMRAWQAPPRPSPFGAPHSMPLPCSPLPPHWGDARPPTQPRLGQRAM